MVMSGRSVNLTTLFLGRLRPPKRLTSTKCAHFRKKLTSALLESAEGKTKVFGQIGYRTGTSGSKVRRATDCATRLGYFFSDLLDKTSNSSQEL